jgi:hypothetical protein
VISNILLEEKKQCKIIFVITKIDVGLLQTQSLA